MYERIQRTGKRRKVPIGSSVKRVEDQYRVLSADFRTTLGTFWDLVEAQQYLMIQVKMERAACPTGGCED